jgi:hypothetical protein
MKQRQQEARQSRRASGIAHRRTSCSAWQLERRSGLPRCVRSSLSYVRLSVSSATTTWYIRKLHQLQQHSWRCWASGTFGKNMMPFFQIGDSASGVSKVRTQCPHFGQVCGSATNRCHSRWPLHCQLLLGHCVIGSVFLSASRTTTSCPARVTAPWGAALVCCCSDSYTSAVPKQGLPRSAARALPQNTARGRLAQPQPPHPMTQQHACCSQTGVCFCVQRSHVAGCTCLAPVPAAHS